MSEFKDPKIKLFGHTINLSEQICSEDRSFNDGGADDQQSPKSDEDVHPPTSTSEESKDSTSPSPKSTQEDETETSNTTSQEKPLKKPDKILPCPRCNSMDTKFCYFNNYNVNQPRHFCKNCQRYWTAGGTMRNVPIGAGRRKTKTSISQFRPHLLTFASPDSSPLCDSMASLFNIAEKSLISNNVHNEFGNNTTELIPNCHLQVPCLPGTTWPYPWNSIRWGSPVHFISPAHPYWRCATWKVAPTDHQRAHNPPTSGPNSPTLGKHSRDDIDGILKLRTTKEEEEVNNHSDKCILTPKTLRIDDPGEAAKSSIWTTLGMKSVNRGDSVVVGGGLFKAFQSQSKNHEKTRHELETSSMLRANPAALSRSMSFQESS